MSTAVAGQVGVYAGRQLSPNNFLVNPATNRMTASFYIFDGNQARDPDNTPVTLLRAGLLCGKLTGTTGDATAPNLGSYANSVVGLTSAAYAGSQTSLTVTPQCATEIVRRFGATGTFLLTGEPYTGAPARSEVITYSAVNKTTGVVTITAAGTAPVAAAAQVNSLVIVDATGSGNFTITVGNITTPAIAYSATAATLVTNINAQTNIAFGTDVVIAAGASLATITLTLRGNLTDSVQLPVYLSGAASSPLTGVTVNGQVFVGTAGATQVAPVSTVGNPPAVTAPVYAVEAMPFVDSTGSGTFSITIEGVTTGAITYSATAATLVNNINIALQATFGPEFVASGATLAAILITAAGPAYAPRPLGVVGATPLTGATGFTVNGGGTVGTFYPCLSSTSGYVAGVALVPWAGGTGNFVVGSIVQPQDGSQTAITIFNEEYGTDVSGSFVGDPSNINQPMQRFEIGGDCYASQVINLTTCSAGCETYLKASLRSKGAVWTFDDDR